MPTAFGFREYGSPDVHELFDIPTPVPGPSEVLINVRAAAVNPMDRKVRSGDLKDVLPRDLPAVLGREASGVVVEVGQDVTGLSAGDEVFGVAAPNHGSFAEQAVLTGGDTAKKPTGVPFEDAAALSVAAATAYDALAQLGLAEGQTLLINGVAGGVGAAAAQLARDAGLFVIGTASDGNREFVESLGATAVAYGQGVAGRVREILADGVDGILDAVGGYALRDVAVLLKPEGRSDGPGIVSTADAATAAELGGAYVSRAHTREVLEVLGALVAEGKLDPKVQDVYPLSEASAAMAAVESGHGRGKVVIAV